MSTKRLSPLPFGRTDPFALKSGIVCASLLLLLAGAIAPNARGQAFGPGTALNLDGSTGYVQVTNGVWFNGNFTIEGWVFVRSYNSWSRLLDFADGPGTNNVYLTLSQGTTGFPGMGVFTNNNGAPTLKATSTLPLNQWVHLAATLSGTTGTIYINGVASGSGPINAAPNVVRTNNYIGKSNYSGDSYANAMFDEIRIWNVARTQAQIQSTMHESISASTPGLVGLWRFDEGSGTSTYEQLSDVPSSLVGGVTWTNSGAPFIPYVSASGATSVAGSNATFNGLANPGNLATVAWFAWGTTTNYGNATAPTNLSAINSNLPISLPVALDPGHFYHYALAATNSAGTNFSGDIQFLLPAPPFVTTLADDGSGGSLRNVVAYVTNGTTITFATNGTITLTNGPITLAGSVNLIGPGPANLIVSGAHSNRVFIANSGTTNFLSGLSIWNGQADSTLNGAGGGIYNAGQLTLSNCDIGFNEAFPGVMGTPASSTGGMFGFGSPGGTGGSGGMAGGIFNSGSLEMIACYVHNNQAGAGGVGGSENGVSSQPPGGGGTGGAAGGLYNSGTATLFACAFYNNTGGNGGAGGPDTGMFGFFPAPGGNGGPCGAIFNDAGQMTLTDCTIDSNFAGAGGQATTGFISQSTNGAPGTIGAISSSGFLEMFSDTITRNNGYTSVGGVYNTGGAAAQNTIIALNTASNSPDCSGSFSSQGYNLIGNNQGSFGFFVGDDNDIVGVSNAPIDPLIAPLAYNGGSTPTVALRAGSPAIDAGDDALLSEGVTTDQRGLPRKSGAHVDIGAYETIIGTPPVLFSMGISNQMFGLAFTNTPYAAFTVLSSTNLTLPLSQWTVAGAPSEPVPGLFQFADPSTTNSGQQFYTVQSP